MDASWSEMFVAAEFEDLVPDVLEGNVELRASAARSASTSRGAMSMRKRLEP